MLTPMGCKVLIEQDSLEEVSSGGIVIVRENEKLERAAVTSGTVVGIGPAAWKAWREIDENGKERNGPAWAKVGDKVVYAKYGGAFITDPETGKEYVLVNDEDLHCVVTGEING